MAAQHGTGSGLLLRTATTSRCASSSRRHAIGWLEPSLQGGATTRKPRNDGGRALATQSDNGKNASVLDVAAELDISVVASATLSSLSSHRTFRSSSKMFPVATTDAQRAISFVRSLPVATALIGTRSRDHLNENIMSASPAPPASRA